MQASATLLRRTGRKIAALLFAAALSLLAAGCGNQQQASAPSTSAQADEVREIKHIMGVTSIKGTPQRVIILTNEGTEALLALGVKPVGAVQSWDGEPWYDHIKQDMEGVTALGFENQPNIEAIAELNPDLIIGNKVRHEKIYEQLQKIAPTVFSEELSGRWKSNFALYAETLNKKAEGERLLQEFDRRVAEAKAKLGAKTASKVSVVKFSMKNVQIYQKDTFSGGLLQQLGVARPESQDKDNFAEALSEEGMYAMDGDVLFYWVSESKGQTEVSEKAKGWLSSPIFQTLNVAKTKQVYQVNETIWNTAGGIKAAYMLLDDIMKRLV